MSNDAPETIWAEPDGDEILIHNGAEDLDQLIHTGYLYEYTLKATSDARIAELERQLFNSRRRCNALEIQATKTRNAALDEARWFASAYRGRDARHIMNGINALKTKEPTKPVKPDVVYDLAVMTFNPNQEHIEDMFDWSETPEGFEYWLEQSHFPTQEGRDKIAAMRKQFERENA